MPEPLWLQYARRQIGIREIPGPRHEPRILAMIERAQAWLGINVNTDEVPWCGTFVADCMQAAGFKPPRGAIAVRAKWWAKWGQDVGNVTRPPVGAIAVFGRRGGGHVGFVTGVYSNGDLNILGGNQGNAVNIRRFPRSRLVAFRWPTGVAWAASAPFAVPAPDTTGEG